jgi:hypothetical protein
VEGRIDWGLLKPTDLSFENVKSLALNQQGQARFKVALEHFVSLGHESMERGGSTHRATAWGEILPKLLCEGSDFRAVYIMGSGIMDGGLGPQAFQDGHVFLRVETDGGIKTPGFAPNHIIQNFGLRVSQETPSAKSSNELVTLSDIWQLGFQVPTKGAGVRSAEPLTFRQ